MTDDREDINSIALTGSFNPITCSSNMFIMSADTLCASPYQQSSMVSSKSTTSTPTPLAGSTSGQKPSLTRASLSRLSSWTSSLPTLISRVSMPRTRATVCTAHDSQFDFREKIAFVSHVALH